MVLNLQDADLASEIIKNHLIHVDREVSVLAASKLMRESGATQLLVTGDSNGTLLAIGIVTANDIVRRVIAAGLDPAVLTAGDITWSGMAGTDRSAGKMSQHIGRLRNS